VTAEELNIRAYSDASGEIIGRLYGGEIVCIYSTRGNWAKTDSGWVSQKYLAPLSSGSQYRQTSQRSATHISSGSSSTHAIQANVGQNTLISYLIQNEIILVLSLLASIIVLVLWWIIKKALYLLTFGMVNPGNEHNPDKGIYAVKDVWLTLPTMGKLFFVLLFVYAFLLVISIPAISYAVNQFEVLQTYGEEAALSTAALIYAGLFALFYMKVFFTYSKGYVVDKTKKEFRFPATDVENTIFEIFTLKQLRDYGRRKKVPIDEITDIYLDTKKVRKYNASTKRYRNETIYTLNIVGTYGSDNLPFSSRQKRDEVRGILVKAARDLKLRVKDRKVAEFS
jgi:hypothetical protein